MEWNNDHFTRLMVPVFTMGAVGTYVLKTVLFQKRYNFFWGHRHTITPFHVTIIYVLYVSVNDFPYF